MNTQQALQIAIGATRARVFINSSFNALPFVQKYARSRLSDYRYNYSRRKFEINKKYLRYESRNGFLYMPVNMLESFIEMLEKEGFQYNLYDEPFYRPRELTIRMKKSFIPRPHQIDAIAYIKEDLPRRKGLAIQTGSGKTVSAISGMIAYGKAGLVVVSRLQQQWIKSIREFTTAKPNQVYLVQGHKSFVDLITSDIKPEIIVFSLETLREYCKQGPLYRDYPPFDEFCKYFGIGFKIMDEVHLNFHACTMIDLSCNIPNNVYLTATFASSDKSTRRIFETVYPTSMQFGRTNIEKYTKAYMYSYFGNIRDKEVIRKRGYSQVKFEQYLTQRPMLLKAWLNDVIHPIMMSHYVNVKNPGEKVLIMVETLEMAEAIYAYCKKEFSEYKTVKFVGGISDKVLDSNEIIIATEKSCGVGKDIKHLRALINIISTRSIPLIKQIFGRLRKIPGVQTEYADICDENLTAQVRHRETRFDVFSEIASEIIPLRL